MNELNSASEDGYRTIKAPCEGLFKAKGSKHFGYVFPLSNESEVQLHLAFLRKEHHAARHHAFAYRLGLNGEIWRTQDDGEPSNSAGPPILGALRSQEVTNCLGVVVRYFGGTKLGVGGLIEAYREAILAAIQTGTIVEKFVTHSIKVEFPYAQMGAVMSIVKQFHLKPLETDFQLTCHMRLEIRASLMATTIQIFSELIDVEATVESPT